MEQDRASALLGVEGVRVVEVDREDDGRVTVWVMTSDPDAVVCPGCQTPAERVHEQVATRLVTCPGVGIQALWYG